MFLHKNLSIYVPLHSGVKDAYVGDQKDKVPAVSYQAWDDGPSFPKDSDEASIRLGEITVRLNKHLQIFLI